MSLRGRLFLTIVGPLVLVACISSVARYGQFTDLSRRLYDNALYPVALTISRDVTMNEGDMLTRNVLEALVNTLGDRIYYRITGPGGAYVTGYSSAPLVPAIKLPAMGKPIYFDASYAGQPVRVLYMREAVDNLPTTGTVTVEVWQTIHQRVDLSVGLLSQSAAYFAVLVTVAALLVWFGIQYGLRPLRELEAAILTRSPDDLRPIEKTVPVEIGALISATNKLLSRLKQAFAIRDTFISDAAHQVRTPIAGIQAQAEAALTAKREDVLRERVTELAFAARNAGRLTNQLLSMERIRGRTMRSFAEKTDLEAMVRHVTSAFAERVLPEGIAVNFEVEGEPRPYFGDPTMLSEMLINLLENAEKYGVTEAPEIDVALRFKPTLIEIDVRDNGPGVPEELRKRIFDRFFRNAPDNLVGCGLGLSIVQDVARIHGGWAEIVSRPLGLCVRIMLGNIVSA